RSRPDRRGRAAVPPGRRRELAIPGAARRRGGRAVRALGWPRLGPPPRRGGPRRPRRGGSSVSGDLAAYSWPGHRPGEALEALGSQAGLGVRPAADVAPPEAVLGAGGERLDRWVEAAAAWIGIEAEPVEVPYSDRARLVAGAGPALVRLPGSDAGGPRFLALL